MCVRNVDVHVSWSAWSEDSESYAGGSIATGSGSHAGQVEGDGPDKRDTMVLPVGGWAWG
jgi:hypothetical protein